MDSRSKLKKELDDTIVRLKDLAERLEDELGDAHKIDEEIEWVAEDITDAVRQFRLANSL